MLVTTSKVCADGSRPFPSNYDVGILILSIVTCWTHLYHRERLFQTFSAFVASLIATTSIARVDP